MNEIFDCSNTSLEVEMDYERKKLMHCALTSKVMEKHSTIERCSPEFLRSINKNLWVDDHKLIETLKRNLKTAQESGPSGGIFQYDPRSESQQPNASGPGAWPSVIVPQSRKPEHGEYPPAVYMGDGKKELHEHV
jgi:hypothetical protein